MLKFKWYFLPPVLVLEERGLQPHDVPCLVGHYVDRTIGKISLKVRDRSTKPTHSCRIYVFRLESMVEGPILVGGLVSGPHAKSGPDCKYIYARCTHRLLVQQ